MSTELERQAEELEELLPEVIRALFPASSDDPFCDLPIGQMRVLRLLSRAPMAPGELAKRLDITPSAIAQVLSRLESLDLILKESSETDRRSKVVELSDHGRALMQQRRVARARRAVGVLQQLQEADRQNLVEVLRRIATQVTAGQP